MQRFQFLLFFAIIAIILSCAKDKLDPSGASCTDDITYNQEIRSIINVSCAYVGCHDGSNAPGNYINYEEMKSSFDETTFLRRVVEAQDMPPAYANGPTSISDENILLMRCWIENGFQE